MVYSLGKPALKVDGGLKILYQLNVRKQYEDGFDFSVATGTGVCFGLDLPVGTPVLAAAGIDGSGSTRTRRTGRWRRVSASAPGSLALWCPARRKLDWTGPGCRSLATTCSTASAPTTKPPA